MAKEDSLGPADLERAARRGLTREELVRQLDLLESPPSSIELDRPCTIGDGIERIEPDSVPGLLAAQEGAAQAGRLRCFIPASGAATRMFKSLLTAREKGWPDRSALEAADDGDARTTIRFLDGIERFAFAPELAHAMQDRGESLARHLSDGRIEAILEGLLGTAGLNLASRPKGLLPFHRYASESRTAFEEHLVEGFAIAGGKGGTRLHFTVGPEHADAFQAELREARLRLESALPTQFDVSFSTQDPATDTIAVDTNGEPFRSNGEMLFRPGGHGSLLKNLADLGREGADLVFVKNIDNVVHDDWRAEVVQWRRILCGRLVLLQERLRRALDRLDQEGATEAAQSFAAEVLASEFGAGFSAASAQANPAQLREQLNRPTRVCAVVRAEGDPGGGPFWVSSKQGAPTRQIVETAQIDQTSNEQRNIQARATHFNPADMILGLKGQDGRGFDLPQYVDHDAVFIAEKSSGGRTLRALEHPGLWNGGMAHWNTLFVEVPAAVFQPVKALPDLLARAHQPAP